MAVNGSAIHGTTASPFEHTPFRATSKPNAVYLFLTEWTTDGVAVPGLGTSVSKAFLLADKEQRPLRVSNEGTGTIVSLPATPPDPICSVVVLELKRRG